ncbi:MAG: bifunctional DNA primase/polymerase [Bacteroidales bacterium]
MNERIPEQLRKHDFRFVKIRKNTKKAFGKKWTKKEGANYEYDDKQFIEWLNKGNNYGVATGFGNLVVIDCDIKEVWESVKKDLPETFTVRTPHGGKHVYYFCDDISSTIRLTTGKAEGDAGDVQWKGKCVVGPTSKIKENGKVKKYKVIHDGPINKVKVENIKAALQKWVKNPSIKDTALSSNFSGNGKIKKIDIKKVIDVDRLKKRNTKYYQGAHPLHGSTNGMNFSVNVEKNLWHCFRHDTGGDALTWIAVKEGIIDCESHYWGANWLHP